MPTEPQPVTLAEAVHRAVEACEDESSEALDELLARFEDAEEPISAIGDVEERLQETVGPIEEGDPAFRMACAATIYLAYRRDAITADAAELLRLAARAEFDGHPPEEVEQWLTDRGIQT